VQAIIDDRGRQYVVHDGDSLVVDLMPSAEVGTEVVFDRVLAVDKTFGTPTVDGASVQGVVAEHFKGKKILVQKFKRRKDYRRKQGHRQQHTRLTITGINPA
jgi:large subunit ribosomal protein L21